jgi:uridine kinase
MHHSSDSESSDSSRHPSGGMSIDELIAVVGARPPRLGATSLVCIDGPAGSGKTTLANLLSGRLLAPVVHMDDLYEGWDGAFDAGLGPRIEEWLLAPWRHGNPAQHPVYDWDLAAYGPTRMVPASPIVILEGVGSGQRAVRQHASLLLWLEAPEAVRRERIIQRDGERLRQHLIAFVAQERTHFQDEGTRDAADLLLSGEAAASVAPIYRVLPR